MSVDKKKKKIVVPRNRKYVLQRKSPDINGGKWCSTAWASGDKKVVNKFWETFHSNDDTSKGQFSRIKNMSTNEILYTNEVK